MKTSNKLKLSLFSGISILTIFSVIFYIIRFINEKQIIFTEKDALFIYLFCSTMIILLIIGIIIGFMLYKIYKQNSKLLEENSELKSKLEFLEKLIKDLFSHGDNNAEEICDIVRDIEDNIIDSIRESEDTVHHIIDKK